MASSGKWLKSLITLKKLPSPDHEKEKQRDHKSKKKWRLWRSSSEGYGSSSLNGMKRVQVASSGFSDSSFARDDAFAAAMATVVRAPPRDFMVIKQEWAAIRIQTAFRGLLARRALRALKAVVRIQAIFRGRKVRKQAAITLRCMQALVRVQARVRAQGVRFSSEGQDSLHLPDDHSDPTKQAEQGWCDRRGTVDEVRARLQMRQEGVMKRERAIAYTRTQQARSCVSPARINKVSSPSTLKNQRMENSSPSRSWLEKWMAAKPWENKPMDEIHTDSTETTPLSRKSEDNIASFYSSSTRDSVKVRRNNITTRVLAKPPMAISHIMTRSSSGPSSDSIYGESSRSTSSTPVSPIPSSSNVIVMDKVVESSDDRKPSYMNLTQSIKAKQKTCRNNLPRYAMEDQYYAMSMPLSGCRELYPPIPLGRHDEL